MARLQQNTLGRWPHLPTTWGDGKQQKPQDACAQMKCYTDGFIWGTKLGRLTLASARLATENRVSIWAALLPSYCALINMHGDTCKRS